MTELELLEETISHYNLGNRCAVNGKCRYSPVTLGLIGVSEGCAIGRKLSPAVARELDVSFNGVDIGNEELRKELPEWMLNLDFRFLNDLQHLHDVDCFWGEKGLNEDGEREVDGIKERIKQRK